MTRRPLILAAVATAVVAAAGYSALWLYAARAVENGLGDWAAVQRAAGASVAYGAPKLSGYPLALRLEVATPQYVAPHDLWRWSGDGLVAEVWPWAFRTVRVRPVGRAVASFPVAGGTETVATTDSTGEITAAFDRNGRFEHGTVDAARLALTTSLAVPNAPPPTPRPPITVAGVHAELTIADALAASPARPDLPASASLALKIDDLTLPDAAAGPLGAHVSRIAATLDLLGRIAPGPPRAALAAWRDAGGTIEVRSAALAWGPLDLSGNATLALDADLQPEGAASADIRGFNETIEALMAHGLIGRDGGHFLEAALTIMAKTQGHDDPLTIAAPLSIQRQRLLVGPFKVMAIPTIDWPQ